MYLFIDTFSGPNTIALFDDQRAIADSITWTEKQREFDMLIEQIDLLVTRNHLEYRDLSGIVVVVGPGGFTGTRIVTLVANTLAMSYGILLYPLTVGEALELMSAPLPWIMPLTKREVIVWSEGAEQYVCITKATLPKGMYSSLDTVDFDIAGYNINHISDLGSLTGRLHLDHGHTIIHPLYAKGANITLKN